MDLTISQKQSKPRPRKLATLNFRLDTHERNALEDIASKKGYETLSDFLRAILRNIIAEERKDN